LKQEDFDRIERYINGESDESERKYVESFFLEGESNLYFRNRLEKDFESMLESNSVQKVDLSHLLDRIHHKIHIEEKKEKNNPLHRFMQVYTKVAAILLIPLVIAGGVIAWRYFFYKSQLSAVEEVSTVINAPMGSRVSFSLPDGTTGMLNSGSRLGYTFPFVSNRKVSLEGEGWFEVKKDEEHPFEVSAGHSTVRVLGTKFNMSAYSEENYVEVVLKEGKVEFTDDKVKEKISVLPFERLVYQGGRMDKSVVEPEKYNAWTEGKLVFRGDPMLEVARRIERWYNVKVIVVDKELERYTFRATFQDDSLEDVLRFLAMTTPISYKIIPSELMPDGTYKKEEVIIWQKNN